jgi:hypothetical protein
MTDPERIAALIEKLEAHGACSWAALMDDAAAQFRADHPARGEARPQEPSQCARNPCVVAGPSLVAQANAVGRAGCEAETEQRRWLNDYTIAEQDMTRGAAHLSALSAAASTLAAVPAMVEALEAIEQRANEHGPGEMALIDTIYAMHALARAALRALAGKGDET